MASGLEVIVQSRFVDGHSPRRAIGRYLMATAGNANTVYWRPPPIHGAGVVMTPSPIHDSRVSGMGQPFARMALDLGPPGENNGRGRLVVGARASGFCGPAPAIGAVQVYNVEQLFSK